MRLWRFGRKDLGTELMPRQSGWMISWIGGPLILASALPATDLGEGQISINGSELCSGIRIQSHLLLHSSHNGLAVGKYEAVDRQQRCQVANVRANKITFGCETAAGVPRRFRQRPRAGQVP